MTNWVCNEARPCFYKSSDSVCTMNAAHPKLNNCPHRGEVFKQHIVSKTWSRVFTHHTRAQEYANNYADKMRAKGYVADVIPFQDVYPNAYRVDVMRKK